VRGQGAQGLNGSLFVIECVKDGQQLGHLKQVFRLLRQIQQLHISVAISESGETGDQLAEAGAIDVVYVSKIENEFKVSIGHETANGFAQKQYGLTDRKASGHVYNNHIVDFTGIGGKTHFRPPDYSECYGVY